MSKIIKRGNAVLIALVSLLFVGSMLTPSVAYADYEYTLTTSVLSGQRGEGVGITGSSGHKCLSGYVSDVEAILTDSQQNVWVSKIATTDQNGYWNPSVMVVNSSAALGTASLAVQCKYPLGTAHPYVSIDTFQVTQQSTQIQVDRTQIYMSSTFSSIPGQGCTPNEWVSIGLYGTAPVNPSSSIITPIKSAAGYADSNGEWSLVFGAADMTDSKFKPNQTYYARATCVDSGVPYASFAFVPRRNEYVAMGDSYSSGLGVYSYAPASGGCYRSYGAYAYYVADVQYWQSPEFRACSGAITDDLYVPNPNHTGEFAQMDPLNGYTHSVTLTIGGNDVGFADIADACANYPFHSGYSCGSSSIADNVEDRIAALRGVDTTPGDNNMIRTADNREIHPIQTVLSDIATKAPNAKVYIAGYPRLFGENMAKYTYDGDAPGSYTCRADDGNGTGPIVTYALSDIQYLNILADELNDVISDAVTALNDPDIEYVEPTAFNGYGLCDTYSPRINPVLTSGLYTLYPESLHPNELGALYGYGERFVWEINN